MTEQEITQARADVDQLDIELGSTVGSAKSADRTLRRVAQCGAIQRRRHEEGMFVFGLMA